MIRFNLALFSTSLFFFSSLHAGIVPFLSQPDWESAVSSHTVLTEDFSGPPSSFDANSVGNLLGLVSVSLLGGVGETGPTGLTGSGFFEGEVDASGTDKLAIEFSFQPSYAFALIGLQDDSLSDHDALDLEEMGISIGSVSWRLSELLGVAKSDVPFLGFVSDQLIDSFTFFHPNVVRTSEEFYLDALAIAIQPQSVPEPPMLLILLSGLFGLLLSGLKQSPSYKTPATPSFRPAHGFS